MIEEFNDVTSEQDWSQEYYFWINKSEDGSNGKGDVGFNTSDQIIKRKDKSGWARISLNAQKYLLDVRQRWPEYMNKYCPELDVNAWWKRIINRTWNKIRHQIRKITGTTIGKLLPFRFRGRMTRDPYIAWATACVILDRRELIESIKLPWYIKTPSFVAWWNYLKFRDELFLMDYRFWKSMWFKSKKDYVIRLNELKELAIQSLQNKEYFFNQT